VRVVLDTNTALSALLWRGTPGKLIDAAQLGKIFLFTSVPLLAELRGVLAREKFAVPLQERGLSTKELFDGYAALAALVTPVAITPAVSRDASDDVVLGTALGARADLIVSGDQDPRHARLLSRHPDTQRRASAEADSLATLVENR
jgi:uncharacterized protein